MGGDQLRKYLFKGDKTIWAVFFIICSISLIEVFSATSRQINAAGSYWFPIIKHAVFLILGILVVIIMHYMKVAWVKKLTYIIYWLGLIGLIWAQISGARINDSARWVKIMGLTFQPMEFAKMGLVMVTALISAQHQDEEGTSRLALKKNSIIQHSAYPYYIKGELVYSCNHSVGPIWNDDCSPLPQGADVENLWSCIGCWCAWYNTDYVIT